MLDKILKQVQENQQKIEKKKTFLEPDAFLDQQYCENLRPCIFFLYKLECFFKILKDFFIETPCISFYLQIFLNLHKQPNKNCLNKLISMNLLIIGLLDSFSNHKYYIYLPIYLYVFLSIFMFSYLSLCFTISLYVLLSIIMFYYLSLCFPIYLYIFLSIFISYYLSLYFTIYLYILLSIFISYKLSLYLSYLSNFIT